MERSDTYHNRRGSLVFEATSNMLYHWELPRAHTEPGTHRVTTTRIAIMPAIGCMIPFVVLFVGAGVGGAVGGTTFAVWGGLAGFAIGLLGALAALRAFGRARDSLPE